MATRFPTDPSFNPRSRPNASIQEQGAGIVVPRSFEANVQQTSAVAQELSGIAKDIRLLVDRSTRMGVTTEDLRKIVPTSDMIYQGVAKALSETMATTTKRKSRVAKPAEPEHDPSWWESRSPTDPTQPTKPTGISPASQGKIKKITGAHEGRIDYKQQYEQAQSHPLGYLRRQFADKAYRRISEMGPHLARDEGGNLRTIRPSGELGEVATGSDIRKANVAGALKGVVGEVAEGKGALAALNAALPGVAELAGPIGAAYGAVKITTSIAEKQRAQGAEYQSILGGTTAEGLVARQQSRLFGITNMGTINKQQAEELYTGVMKTGMSGEQQQRAMTFGVDAYKRFGMSMSESVRLIEIASRRGQDSLGGLREALDGVTKSAKESGINAQAMREQFTRTFEAVSTQIGPRAAIGVSQALTEAQAGLGRPFQDVSFAGLTGTSQLRMAGAQSGKSLAQIEAMSIRDKSGASVATMVTQQARRFTSGLLNPRAQQMISRLSGRKVSQEEIESVSADILDTGIDPEAVQQVLAQAGIQVDTARAVPTLVALQSGAFDPGAKARATATKSKVSTIAPGKRAERARKFVEGQHARGLRGLLGGDPGQKSEAQAYGDIIKKTGRESQVIEKLITDFDAARMYRVKTASGDRIVTLDEGMQYYRDQFERGDVEIISGAGEGQTVAQAVGLPGGDMSVQAKTATQKPPAGMAVSRWEERNKGKETPGGKITIEPTAELKRLFKFTGTGIASTDPADLLIPPSPHTVPEALSTGNE